MLCARRFNLAVVALSLLAPQLIAQPAANGEGEFAVLIDGLGNYSRPISTKSELAQKFFDQGLRLGYGYYSPEATASFKEALRHDPDNPMLHWAWRSRLEIVFRRRTPRRRPPKEAELIYSEDLKEFRNNGWSLFGLAQSLRARGKPSAAGGLRTRVEDRRRHAESISFYVAATVYIV